MDALARTLPLAEARGVTLLAGTDLFPEVTVGDEIAELHALGVSWRSALGAGSWNARAWLGEPGLVEGAPADLVLYRSDPREDRGAIFHPELVLIGGRRIDPTLAHVRPEHVSWSDRE
jgi:imidazolonepropionase-like amidohydrolase